MEHKKETIELIANTIRALSIDAVQKANSGHPGMPMGMADIAATLWCRHLNINPKNPNWYNRDRFILSCGHGSMLLYSLLHLAGFDLSLDDLKNFRQLDSKTPGHPEYGHTEGVETTTGPLGQGLANAVGMALAESHLSASTDKNLIDHFTYVFASDGDLQEGLSHEACSFAGHNKLSKLIVFYDDNQISIDGETSLSFSEDIPKRFESYGWHIQQADGHDIDALDQAIEIAKLETHKPSIIVCKTTIGKFSPSKAGKASSHGAPLGVDEIQLTKDAMGYPSKEDFFVPQEVYDFFKEKQEEWNSLEEAWKLKFNNSDFRDQIISSKNKDFDLSAFDNINSFDDAIATRSASGKVLDNIFSRVTQLIGGSADLTPSNNTFAKDSIPYSNVQRNGRYVHYGIREHAMGAMMNGMALYGGLVPYAGTFLVFSDYMRPSIRLAALMGLQVIYVFTHDSIGLGEDGPTHQPVEHIGSFVGMPNFKMIRPADGNETKEAWRYALKNQTGPTAIVLSRQKLVSVSTQKKATELHKGAYILEQDAEFEYIIMASGSEVEIAKKAKERLNEMHYRIRIVSVPSLQIFEAQNEGYQRFILPLSNSFRVAIEAGATQHWKQFVGLRGKVIGVNEFGASAPYTQLYDKFGITVDRVVEEVISFKKIKH